MRAVIRNLGIYGFLLLIGATAWAGIPGSDWSVSTAPARFAVEPDQADPSVPVSWATLCLPNPDWANMPVRVFTEAGVAVGSDFLWTAPGEPATVIFDSSSNAKRYYFYVGSNWPALHLDNAKAGVTLESRAGDGKTINNLPDMLQAWNQSPTTYGRAMIQGLFEGGHRFGPQGNILEHFQGWFNATDAEHLELAAISSDASFVLVDGKEVVEWPGRHDFHDGLSGQHQGAVDLAAGIHSLDYYNAFVASDEGHPLLCCLAAKGGTLANWTMLSPDAGFFEATGHAHVADYQLQSNGPNVAISGDVPAFAVDWALKGQSMIAPEISDIGLISVQLTCRPDASAVAWTFDDGTTVQGQTVQHLFPRPGMRTVQMDVNEGDKTLHFSQTINVHPNWTQLTTFPPQLTPEHQADIMGRDPATFSASDLAGCVAVFEVFKDSDGLLKLLPAVCSKIKDIPDADLPYVKDAAVFLAREDLLHYAETSQLLKALVDRCSSDKPSAQLIAVGSASRLSLAQLTLKTSDQTDDVRKLMDGINIDSLSGEDRRSFDLLRGDLAMATGDISGARKQYDGMMGNPVGPDARSSIRRVAKIDQARSFLDRKEFEAAERALSQAARQSPLEKLTPDWTLTRLSLYEKENLPVVAYLWAKRLLPVITDDGRSELLFQMTDLAYAQGDNDLANNCLAELLKKHPYSSEAAEAKEKWPGKE